MHFSTVLAFLSKKQEVTESQEQHINQQAPPKNSHKKSKLRQSLFGKIIRFLWFSIRSITSAAIILFFLLWISLKFPLVQNWLAQRTTEYLSNELGTVVRVEKVDIQLFNKASMKNFYMEDYNKDTLIFAADASGQFDVSQILKGKFLVTAVDLKDGILKYQRLKGQREYNITTILRYFQPKKKKKKKAGFQLAIKHIRFENVAFDLRDEVVGTEIKAFAPNAVLHSNKSNILAQMAEIDSLYAKNCTVKIRVFQGFPLPDSLKKIPNANLAKLNWLIKADKVNFENLEFDLQNEKRGQRIELPLDINDLQLKKTNLKVDKLELKDYVLTASIRQFNAKEKRGFEIKSFFGDIKVASNGSDLRNFELQTNSSVLGNHVELIYDKYSDFLDFAHKVKIIAGINNSQISFGDMMAFAAPLNKIPFFVSNRDKTLLVDAYFEGKVDSFTVSDIVLNMNNTHLEGNLSMMPFKKYISFEIQDLQTNYFDINSLFSFTKLPKQLANLGKMNFYGDFSGYLDKEFTARGNLNTDLGESKLNLTMMPKGSSGKVEYQGKMLISDFDIRLFSGNKELGKLDAYFDFEGKGLSVNNLELSLNESRINYFDFKSYRYDTIHVDGVFNQKKFIGDVRSADPNFNINLNGNIDFNERIPSYLVRGVVNRVDFCALKLLNENLILSVDDVDLGLRGSNFDNFKGFVDLKNIDFHRGWGDYHVDYIKLQSIDTINSSGDSSKLLRLNSDIVSGKLEGHFTMVNLKKSLYAFAEKYYPNFIRTVNYAVNDSVNNSLFNNINIIQAFDTLEAQDIAVELDLYDSKKLSEIISPDFKYVKGAKLKLEYDSRKQKIAVNMAVDSLKWGGFRVKNEKLVGDIYGNRLNLENSIGFIQQNDSTSLPAPYVKLGGRGDSISFNISVNEIGKIASNINLNGDLKFNRENLNARLNNSNLRFLDTKWFVEGDNYLAFDFVNKNIQVHDVKLQDSAAIQKISLSSFGNRGLELNIDNVDLSRFYDPVKLPLFDIDGFIYAQVRMADVINQKDISATINFKKLVINKDNWNSARLELKTDNLKDTIDGGLYHSGPMAENLNAKFSFIPAYATKIAQDKNYVDIKFDAKQLKGRILEYFMVGQLTNTLGTADVKDGRIYGVAPKLKIKGLGTIKNLETTFNFLNTRYYIDTAAIVLSDEGMIFSPAIEFDEYENVKSGIVIRDQEGNNGYIGGRILHKNLKEWGIDLDLFFNKNLTLNTSSESNMPFYGKVWATGRANISGPFNKMTMVIDAVTESGPKNEQSILVLPIMKPVEINQAIDYIVFRDMKDSSKGSTYKKPKVVTGGIEVQMKIKATKASMARIIIDEQAGDVIEGSGNGDLQLNYTPSGELYLYGDYEIDNGNYLFTYRNFINKPFKVEKGGTIRWNGDPYNADVNIKAKYVQKSRLYNLLLSYQEELQNSEVREAANKPVDVEVLMNMTGSLMRPDIKFGLNIVGSTEGRVASLAGLAIKAIQQDDSKLNRQVFGLIALNQFLPEVNAAANLNIGTSSFNTLTEMISQQFSRYLGDLLSEVVEDQNVISSIDVQIGYKMEDDQLSRTGTGSQFDLSIDNYFLKDKLKVHIGGNLDVNNSQNGANQNYFGGDVVVEYSLSGDGNLKLKLYNRYENSLFGQRNRAGGGISYQLDFDAIGGRKKKKNKDKEKKSRKDLRKEEEEDSLK